MADNFFNSGNQDYSSFYTGTMAPPTSSNGTLTPSTQNTSGVDYSGFYTGSMAPPVQAGGTLVAAPVNSGLVSRSVTTVPIDLTTGNPVAPGWSNYIASLPWTSSPATSSVPHASGTVASTKDQSRLPNGDPILLGYNPADPTRLSALDGIAAATNIPAYRYLPTGDSWLTAWLQPGTMPVDSSVPLNLNTYDPKLLAKIKQRAGTITPPSPSGSRGIDRAATTTTSNDPTAALFPWIVKTAPGMNAQQTHEALMAQQNQSPTVNYNGGAQTTTASGTPLQNVAASQRWAAAFMADGGVARTDPRASRWERALDDSSKLLSNSGLGTVVDSLFPNLWNKTSAATAPSTPNPEWDGIRAQFARGGVVGYADGGPVQPDPRVMMIADAEDALHAGDMAHPAIQRFAGTFGNPALEALRANVQNGMRMRGRMVRGPGTATSDGIPAVVVDAHGAHSPVRLSDGEFVMPVAAVRGIGGGDHALGAERLQQLSDRFAKAA